jgi:site-specific recombinase XerD
MPRKTFRKIITSDAEIEKINPKNKHLIEKFLKEKNTRLSNTSITNYRSHLNIFFVWNVNYNENKFFCDIRKSEFLDYFSFVVTELKWNSAHFNGARSCLSTLSVFIEKFMDDEFPNFRNVILKTIEGMPKNDAREKTVLSEEQVNSLFAFLEKEKEVQDACLLALAISSGSRISELLCFTTDIINENNLAFNDLFLETTKKIKTKGRTKQGKLLNKYIIKDIFLPHYKKWLVKRTEIMEKNNQSHNFIFIKNNGTPAEETNVRSWIKKWEEFLQVPFYMHSLRHYLVTYLTRLGLSTEFIVEIMGWSGSAMFPIYNDLGAKDREWQELSKLEDDLKSNIT